jgi:hypothetical protein
MAQTPIQIRVHPPERRQRRGVVLYGTCCCSCCCCCLHVIGGVLGALLGSAPANQAPARRTPPPEALEKFRYFIQPTASDRGAEGPEEAITPANTGLTESPPTADMPALPTIPSPDVSAPPDRRLPGTYLYWVTVLVLTVIACLGGSRRSGPTAEHVLLVVFGYLPAVQLAAALVAALLVFLWPADERPLHWHTIWRIARGAFLGTILGLLVMSPCLLPLFK